MSGRQQRVLVQPIVCFLIFLQILSDLDVAECHLQKSATSSFPLQQFYPNLRVRLENKSRGLALRQR